MLKTNNLNIGYTQKGNITNIVSDINITANKGDLIALIGVNGSGKSTLIRAFLKFQDYISGDILLNDKSLKSYTNNELAENISYVASRLTEQNNITAKDLISLGRLPYTKWFGILSDEDKQIINDVINTLGIENLAGKQFNNLSDGEKQKVLVARALAQNTDLIILDEPTSHLDLPGKFELTAVLKKLTKENNKAVIFSTHDLNIAFANADIIWFIFDNKLISGTPKQIIENQNFRNIFKDSSLSEDEQNRILSTLF